VIQRGSSSSERPNKPYDPETQWSRKNGEAQKERVGYKAQVAETVEKRSGDGEASMRAVLTAVLTQEATTSDWAALAVEAGDYFGLALSLAARRARR